MKYYRLKFMTLQTSSISFKLDIDLIFFFEKWDTNDLTTESLLKLSFWTSASYSSINEYPFSFTIEGLSGLWITPTRAFPEDDYVSKQSNSSILI